MKKLYIKSVLLTAAAATTLLAAAQSQRIDYLDPAGKILYSGYPSTNTTAFSVYEVCMPEGTTFYVSGSGPGSLGGLKVTPWGVETYSATLGIAEENVKFSCTVVDDTGAPKTTAEAPAQIDVRCGDVMNITVEVPDGTFPALDVECSMTGAGGVNSALPENQLQWMNFDGNAAFSFYSWYRKDWENILSGTGIFTRDADNPNRWTATIVMPNEPVEITAFAQRRDAKLLRNITVNALRDLYRQYGEMTPGVLCSGETYLMSQFGDYMGQDLVSGFLCLQPSVQEVMLSMNSLKGMNYFMSFDIYGLACTYITHANMVLSRIDGFTDASPEDRNWARAQMLALRSHGYWRLMQHFGARWQDSDGGEAYCAPLETTFPLYDTPLAKMREIRDQCYADLDEAIAMLGSFERVEELEIDAATARGIKMRMAMLCEDWPIVDELAAKILADRPLTTNEELLSGFFQPAQSWIWSASNHYLDENGEFVNQLYYWSWQAHEACNGSYPAMWGHGANAIDKDLYLSISETDVRRRLFAMPDQLVNPLFTRWQTWYQPGNFDEKLMALAYGSIQQTSQMISGYISSKGLPAGVDYGPFQYSEGYSTYDIPVQFGAQMKYYQPGSPFDKASVVFMRSEEILLSQAEAACHLGNNEMAIELLNRLNRMRDPQYDFSATGQELLDEIIRTRRVELWGEGHSWTDRKRWNLPIERNIYVLGKIGSGNWPSRAAQHIAADACNGWRYLLPSPLILHNSAIDVSLMKYDDLGGGTYPTPSTERPSVSAEAPSSGQNLSVAPSLVDKKLHPDPQSPTGR